MAFAHSVFQIQAPLDGWAFPAMAGVETRRDPSYRYAGRTRPDRPHCIFQFTLAGCGQFRDGAGVHALPAGTGFLCESNDPLTAYEYPAEGRGGWRFVYVALRGEAAHLLTRALVRRHGALYQLPVEAPLIHRLVSLAGDRGMLEKLLPAAEGLRLAAELFAALAEAAGTGAGPAPESALVRRVRESVGHFAGNNLRVGDVAAMAGVSREHLTRVFQRQLGVTPARYLARQRMLLACDWLRDTAWTVKEIAYRLGFPAPPHFVRVFRRVTGMTPRQYRESGTLMPVL